jgi:cytochrome o ubiquinol oxidase subunit 2
LRSRMTIPKGAQRPRVLCLLLAAAAPGVCVASILDPVGPVGIAERTILFDSLAIMLAIVVPTILATLAFAYWYRASNQRARYMPDWAYSGRLELIVWSIPALVILFLGGIAWLSSHRLDPAQPLDSPNPPLEIEVVSLDWRWLFIYPKQHVASINELVVPIGVPLHLRITSATVMNVFFVPRLGSQIYSMNGMVTQLNLEADQAGVYPGLSANFSGDGFSGMHFSVRAGNDQEFANWVASARQSRVSLDDAAYGQLRRQSQDERVYTYGSTRDGLFEDIASRKLAPGEGPPTDTPAGNIRPRGGQ